MTKSRGDIEMTTTHPNTNATMAQLPWSADLLRDIDRATVAKLTDLARIIAPRGQIGAVTDHLRHVQSVRAARRRNAATPVSTVRAWIARQREIGYAFDLDIHGPIPARAGAGDLEQVVTLGNSYDCRRYYSYGERPCNAYKYSVIDITMSWEMPASHILRVVDGVVTGARRADFSRSATEPVPAHWPRQIRGYAGAWVDGYLYRGVHFMARTPLALKSARTKIDRQIAERERRERAGAELEAQLSARAAGVWITAEALRRLGACQPGIDAARRDAEARLGAAGEIGAVRADVVLAWGGRFTEWARRIVAA
jgi:hypothetical protein